ncbi:MAG: type II secretion system F family protein [Thermoguttaceae bacterium]|jgi:type II secretory pathway component PulF|nr:type II secretion system F family protein [Thermoguttaceae bacterium]
MLPDSISLNFAIHIAAGLLAVGAVVWIALGVIERRVRVERREMIAVTRVVLGIAIVALMAAPLLFFLVLGIPVLFVVAGIVVPMVVLQRTRARREAMFDLIVTSFRRRIPLETTLPAFGGHLGQGIKRRAHDLSDKLRHGDPLGDALRTTPGLIPREALPLLAVSVESGALAGDQPEAAAHSIMNARRQMETVRQSTAGKVFYLLGVLAFMVLVGLFFALKIAPRIERVFDEFDLALPRMSQFVLTVMHQGVWASPFALLALFGLFVYAVVRLGYGIPLDLPGVGHLLRPLDKAAVLEAMSIGMECNRPIPETLAILARTYPKASLRHPLWQAHDRVANGADWIDSLLANRIIRRPDAALLRSAAAAGNLPWAMRAVADSSRRLFTYRTNVLLQIAFPIAICVLACVVAVVVVGLFMPLIRLIVGLT